MRPENTLLGENGVGALSHAPMVDIRYSGQHGFISNIGTYVANANYIPMQLVALLLEAPRGFNYLPQPDVQIGMLKSLVEDQAHSITGLNRTLEVSFVSVPVSGSGEVQEDVSDVTRTRSQPTFSWYEKEGRSISYFFEQWITYLLMDPDAKYPMLSSIVGSGGPTDLLPDYRTMTVLFFEPDRQHKYIVNAWLSTNMMPNGTGDWTSRRNKTDAPSTVELQIQFSALTQSNYGVRDFAQRLLDRMNMQRVNPDFRPSYLDEIDAAVAAQKVGYTVDFDNSSNFDVPPAYENVSPRV